jgi:hypothetical protein
MDEKAAISDVWKVISGRRNYKPVLDLPPIVFMAIASVV